MPSLFIEAESKPSVRGTDAWDSLEQIFDFLTRLLSVASQITLILNLSRSTGGLTFAIICLIKPIFNAVFTRNLWDKGTFCSTLWHFWIFKHDGGSLYYLFTVWFAYVDNEDHNRKFALQALVGEKYRQDIISNNIGEWIVNGQYLISFKRCLWNPFIRIQDRIQTTWGCVWWSTLRTIYSKGVVRFWYYKQVAWWIANSVFITTIFYSFSNLTWEFLYS